MSNKDTAECMVLGTRKAARAITRLYNAKIRHIGLTSTQVSVLFAIDSSRHQSITDMADNLALERSSLTRNIKLLENRQLVEKHGTGRGRSQIVSLTSEGDRLMKIAYTHWIDAQSQLRAEMGETRWTAVHETLELLGNLDCCQSKKST